MTFLPPVEIINKFPLAFRLRKSSWFSGLIADVWCSSLCSLWAFGEGYLPFRHFSAELCIWFRHWPITSKSFRWQKILEEILEEILGRQYCFCCIWNCWLLGTMICCDFRSEIWLVGLFLPEPVSPRLVGLVGEIRRMKIFFSLSLRHVWTILAWMPSRSRTMATSVRRRRMDLLILMVWIL